MEHIISVELESLGPAVLATNAKWQATLEIGVFSKIYSVAVIQGNFARLLLQLLHQIRSE